MLTIAMVTRELTIYPLNYKQILVKDNALIKRYFSSSRQIHFPIY